MVDHGDKSSDATRIVVVDANQAPGGGDEANGAASDGSDPQIIEAIEQPAKVMRIGSMIRQLLDEVRQAPLDQASRQRLREIYDRSVTELSAGLSPDLQAELDRLALPFETEDPSESELRIAQAQLLGWLEGLFHGIQAALFAQQMVARSQLEEMRGRELPKEASGGLGDPGSPFHSGGSGGAGPYL